MSNTRRKFSTEYKVEAAHRVIDSGRTCTEVARELSLSEGYLREAWAIDERRRIQAAQGSSLEPLSGAERAELIRIRKELVEKEKDLAFLKKATVYFAKSQPK
jgi:transposase-like protein